MAAMIRRMQTIVNVTATAAVFDVATEQTDTTSKHPTHTDAQ